MRRQAPEHFVCNLHDYKSYSHTYQQLVQDFLFMCTTYFGNSVNLFPQIEMEQVSEDVEGKTQLIHEVLV